jgi:solute carrier family 25 phosphate transporter 23/24/25/41
MFDFNQAHFIEATLGPTYMDPLFKPNPEIGNRSLFSTRVASAKALLIEILPDAGYFFAGGVAGAVSRTATAPLDRLKVYLIANVDARRPVATAKQAGTTTAVKNVGRPLVVAFQELWKAGGMRSLFAGMSSHMKPLCETNELLGNGLNVLKVMPESAIKFGSFEGAKRAMAQFEGHGDPSKINSFSKFIAGGTGGVISQ